MLCLGVKELDKLVLKLRLRKTMRRNATSSVVLADMMVIMDS